MAFSNFGVKLRYLLVKNIFKNCGGNVNVAKGVYFGKGNNISIGYNSGIGEGSYFICLDEIIIGDNVMMAPFIMIFTGGHDYKDKNKLLVYQDVVTSPVKIGNDVWVGARATILPGVTIEDRVIISAGSVLYRGTYHSGWIYAGNPAKKTKEIPKH